MVIWVEIVCARCADTCAGNFIINGRIPQKQMCREAIAAGWTLEKGGDFICNSWRCKQMEIAESSEAE